MRVSNQNGKFIPNREPVKDAEERFRECRGSVLNPCTISRSRPPCGQLTAGAANLNQTQIIQRFRTDPTHSPEPFEAAKASWLRQTTENLLKTV